MIASASASASTYPFYYIHLFITHCAHSVSFIHTRIRFFSSFQGFFFFFSTEPGTGSPTYLFTDQRSDIPMLRPERGVVWLALWMDGWTRYRTPFFGCYEIDDCL